MAVPETNLPETRKVVKLSGGTVVILSGGTVDRPSLIWTALYQQVSRMFRFVNLFELTKNSHGCVKSQTSPLYSWWWQLWTHLPTHASMLFYFVLTDYFFCIFYFFILFIFCIFKMLIELICTTYNFLWFSFNFLCFVFDVYNIQ